jgi:hypothetical protein
MGPVLALSIIGTVRTGAMILKGLWRYKMTELVQLRQMVKQLNSVSKGEREVLNHLIEGIEKNLSGEDYDPEERVDACIEIMQEYANERDCTYEAIISLLYFDQRGPCPECNVPHILVRMHDDGMKTMCLDCFADAVQDKVAEMRLDMLEDDDD